MSKALVEKVLISDIDVGARRREDFGDIEGLAASIDKYGLLHPIVVDNELNLIAGERRLRAHIHSGRTEILVRYLRDLTEDERREIELEENVRRKDLTPVEISRNMVALAEAAAEVIKEAAGELLPTVGNNSKPKRGAPPKPVTTAKVAERIGIPRQTIERAQEHVAAVNKYPELVVVAPTQKDAITVAKNLDRLDDTERSEARSRLMKHDQAVLATLAEKPPMPKVRVSLDKSPSRQWSDWLTSVRTGLAGLKSLPVFIRHWSPDEVENFVADLRVFRDDLDNLISTLEDEEHGLEQQAG